MLSNAEGSSTTDSQPGTVPGPSTPRRRWKGLLPDSTPWRVSRDFRLVWSSGAVTSFGTVLTLLAIPVQMKQLTGSPLAVGLIGVTELVPMVLFGLYGGALADAFDRRRMALYTEIGLGVLSLVLLLNSLLDRPRVWPLYVVVAAAAALQGLQGPSMSALVPRLVPHDQLRAALALNSLRSGFAAIVGTAIAGVLIATLGLTSAFAIDVASFTISALLLARVRPVVASHEADPPSLRSIRAGLSYVSTRPELLGGYLVDSAANLLALPTALLAFLAADLHRPWALGLLFSATAVGSLCAASTSGWTNRVHRHGRAVFLAVGAWGTTMALVGLSSYLWLTLLLFALAGAAQFVGDLFRGTIFNESVPDRFRGRLAGIEVFTGSGGPALGDLRAGLVASRIGVRPAIWTGGLACVVAVGGLATALRSLWHYDSTTNPHVATVRAEVGRHGSP